MTDSNLKKTPGVPSQNLVPSTFLSQSMGTTPEPDLPIPAVGLVLWLDADDSDSFSLNGANVIQWNDKSGLGRHVSQAVDGNRPELISAALNGRDGVDFDGTEYLESTQFPVGDIGDVFIVFDTDGINGDMLSVSQPDVNNRILLLRDSRFSGGSELLQLNGGDNAGVTMSSNTPAGTPFIIHFKSDGSAWTIDVDGVSQSLNTFGEQNGDWFGDIGGSVEKTTIGASQYFSSVFGQYDGTLFEILLYDGVNLSGAEISEVETYLSDKWGISI